MRLRNQADRLWQGDPGFQPGGEHRHEWDKITEITEGLAGKLALVSPKAPVASMEPAAPKQLGIPRIEESFNECGYLFKACKEQLKNGGHAGVIALNFTYDLGALQLSARHVSDLAETIGSSLIGRIEGGYQAARGEYFLLLVPGSQPYSKKCFHTDQQTIYNCLIRQFRDISALPQEGCLQFGYGGVFLGNCDGETAGTAIFHAFRDLFSASAPSPAGLNAERREIENIIERGLITPVYQPIFSLKEGTLLGYESLSRLDRSSTISNPEQLFAKAVEYGLAAPLEMLCRRKALLRAREVKLPGKLFLNVCPSLLLSGDHMRGSTAALLDELGMRRSDVTFELTERTLIEDYALFKRALSHYRDQGYSIAIDDLGSGYAGLKMLSELEPEYVKLSNFLIRDIDSTATKQALVEALVSFCAKTGAQVIAEGIETAAEKAYLVQSGVAFGQGYLLGRPSPELI